MNMKKISLMLVGFGCISLAASAFADIETCPKVSDLKKVTTNKFNGWRLLNLDEEGAPLTTAQAKAFAKKVDGFTLAEYDDGAPEGAAMCYYGAAPDYLGVYLAKHNLVVDTNDANWKPESKGSDDYNCTGADVTACTFVSAH